jgi:hypothetical protein
MPAFGVPNADVLRWLAWKSAHWDAESVGMVTYEKSSKAVLGLASPDPAFIARGEQNFARFAVVLNNALRGNGLAIQSDRQKPSRQTPSLSFEFHDSRYAGEAFHLEREIEPQSGETKLRRLRAW